MAAADVLPGACPRGRKVVLTVLPVLLLVATVLRVAYLTHAPPGLNQDEAANAWNAWCLLKTGRDQAGTPWPIFYTQALGGNRPTLFLYAVLPFQAVGGMNVWTTRLPSAVGGVLTIFLLYWITARLFNRPAGLVAAALLTLSPWHIQLSRLGHEAALGPLSVTLSIAALLWAGFPLCDGQPRPRPWRALLAGLAVGGACYGYAAVRLFLPLFLAGCVLLTARAWWRLVKTRQGAAALAALVIGVGLTFGPLVYQHLAQPEQIARRAEHIQLWEDADPLGAKVGKVLARYAAHFGPDFLFLNGDRYEVLSAQGFGVYHWYGLPLIVLGLPFVLRDSRRSRAARILLCWLLLYPVGDGLHQHEIRLADGVVLTSANVLRSAPGLCAPLMLAALGAVAAGRWLWRKSRTATTATLAVLALAALLCNERFIVHFFGDNNRRPAVYHGFHADLMEACAWLRPRVDDADAVFITAADMNLPYIVTLVGVGYEPEQWFRAERDVRGFPGYEWEYYFRVGRFHFVHDRSSRAALQALQDNGRPDRVIFIMRPGEIALPKPVHTILGPEGTPILLVYDVEL